MNPKNAFAAHLRVTSSEVSLEASEPFPGVPLGPGMQTIGPLLAPLRKIQIRLFSESPQEGFFPSIREHCQRLMLSLEVNRNESRGGPTYGLNVAFLGSGQKKMSV